MKVFSQLAKSMLLKSSAVGLLLVSGMFQVVGASPPQAFSGTADLCAIDMSNVEVVVKGKGQTITKNQVYLFRFESDHPLMIGYETIIFDTKVTANGNQYSIGESYVDPDNVEAGALVEKFNFLVEETISGTLKGIGSLKGVTVDYNLTINEVDPAYCDYHPYCEEEGAQCQYLRDISPYPFGYDMSGRVFNW